MRRRRVQEESTARNAVGWLVLIAMVVALWWFVLPPALGGRTTLLTTHGISMEPILHDGDLAILRAEPSYKVGDVVEYHSGAINAPVLHRIVGVEPNGTYDTKGDNNDFVDLDHPTSGQIIGKMIHRYAGFGKRIGIIKSTPVRIIGAFLVAWAVYSAIAHQDRTTNMKGRDKKKARQSVTSPSSASSRIDDSVADHVLEDQTVAEAANESTGQGFQPAGLAGFLRRRLTSRYSIAFFTAIAMVSAVFAIPAYAHAASTAKDEPVIYSMRGAFNYSANAAGGDLVYRNGQAQTGDTLYYSMVNSMFVTFKFDVTGIGRYKGGGTAALQAVVKGSSGWSHPIPLMPAQSFPGDTDQVNAVIDLTQIRQLVTQIDNATKVSDANYTLSLEPTVTLDGTINGAKVKDSLSPALDFSGSSTMLKPAAGGANNGPKALNNSTTSDVLNGLSVSKGGQIIVPAGSPKQLRALGIALGVLTLRVITTIGIFVGLAGIAAAYTGRRKPRSQMTPAELREATVREHSDLFVPIAKWGQVGTGAMIIDLPSLDDLVRVAESHSSIILQENTADGKDLFVVNHRHLTYRFQADPTIRSERRFNATMDSAHSADGGYAE